MRRKNHNSIQEKYWDKISSRRKMLRWEEVPYPAIKEMNEFFRFFNPKRNDSILEIGCGSGRYTLPLLRQGHNILGTDLSQRSLNILKRLASKEGLSGKLKTEKNDFEDAKNCKRYFNKFNQALMVAVIHHFNPQKREEIFKNIVTSVKKDGWVVAIEPNPLNPLYYLLYFWRWLRNSDNSNRWSTEKGMLFTNIHNLRKLFGKSGLNYVEVSRYALLPSSFGNRFKFVLILNDFLVKIPIIKELSAFIWIKGKKI